MVKKDETPKASSGKKKAGGDAVTGQFMARAKKWASANSATREAASDKLKEMGIYDESGKLAKDYR